MKNNHDLYTLEPFPKMRRFSLDAGYMGRRKHIIHGLVEVDVTRVRQYIRQHAEKTGEKLSFTAYIIYCLAQAVEANPHMHAYLDWRNRLVIYKDVNINTMVEIPSAGRKVPMPYIIKAANVKTYRQIHDEIRAVQSKPQESTERKFMSWFLMLPAFVRHAFYRIVTRMPHLFREYSSSVLVTAVGMFAKGTGWGIPVANFTLSITLGSISEKPGVVEGRIEIREYLHMTVSIDHDIVDGAPAARFANHFVSLIEKGEGLA